MTDKKKSFSQIAARFSWILPLSCIGLMMIGNAILSKTSDSGSWFIMGSIFILLLLGGIVAGIIGCFGVKAHGARSTVVPGMVGIGLGMSIIIVMASIAIPAFQKYKEAARDQQQLSMMHEMAVQTNSQLPNMIDEQTRLDKCVVLDSRNIKYQLTLVSYTKDQIDKEMFIRSMKPQLNTAYYKREQFKVLRDYGIGVLYEYYDQNGELFASISANDIGPPE